MGYGMQEVAVIGPKDYLDRFMDGFPSGVGVHVVYHPTDEDFRAEKVKREYVDVIYLAGLNGKSPGESGLEDTMKDPFVARAEELAEKLKTLRSSNP